MKIAVASPPIIEGLKDGLYWLQLLVEDAASQQAEIICFPESYLPGYPGMNYPEEDRSAVSLHSALQQVCKIAAANHIAVVLPMDWHLPGGLYNLAHVVSATGEVLGYQTKNQLDPSEDNIWIPGKERSIFNVNGLKFGLTICHEGFRYPESVRWAAQQGAKLVFHPHFAGSNTKGPSLAEWGIRTIPTMKKQ
jgi:predicted amidohydrolase